MDYSRKNRNDAPGELERIRDLLNIDQHILKISKTRRKSLALTWISHRKVNDIGLKKWMKESWKMYQISNKIINFITEAMKNWKVEITAGGKAFEEVKIKRYLPRRHSPQVL